MRVLLFVCIFAICLCTVRVAFGVDDSLYGFDITQKLGAFADCMAFRFRDVMFDYQLARYAFSNAFNPYKDGMEGKFIYYHADELWSDPYVGVFDYTFIEFHTLIAPNGDVYNVQVLEFDRKELNFFQEVKNFFDSFFRVVQVVFTMLFDILISIFEGLFEVVVFLADLIFDVKQISSKRVLTN